MGCDQPAVDGESRFLGGSMAAGRAGPSADAAGFVSPELFVVVGAQPVAAEVAAWPKIQLCAASLSLRLRLILDPRRQDWFERGQGGGGVSIHIRPAALDEWLPAGSRRRLQLDGTYFPTEDIAVAAHDIMSSCAVEPNRRLFLAYKAAGLVWLVLDGLRSGSLAMAGESDTSVEEMDRLHVARRMIHERFSEPLSLDAIAKACGLSRSKLTQGFRDVFKSSVGEALLERRLQQAAQKLHGTDAPVSSIGYRTGYTSNAAFTRAFTRRFGQSPTAFRARRRQPPMTDRTLAAVEALL